MARSWALWGVLAMAVLAIASAQTVATTASSQLEAIQVENSAANVNLNNHILDLKNFDMDTDSTLRGSIVKKAQITADSDFATLPPRGVYLIQYASRDAFTGRDTTAAVNAILGTPNNPDIYVETDGYICLATSQQVRSLAALLTDQPNRPAILKYIGRMLPQMKINRMIKSIEEILAASPENTTADLYKARMEVRVSLYPIEYTQKERDDMVAFVEKELGTKDIPYYYVDWVDGSKAIEVGAGHAYIRSIANVLAELELSVWVEDKTKKVLRRDEEEPLEDAVEFMKRTGRTLLNQNSAGVVQSGAAGQTTIWNKGITGKDQIIGVADSGVDWDNCYLSDASLPVPFYNVKDPIYQTNPTAQANFNHRKVVAYQPYRFQDPATEGYRSDDEDGHGTHVAGSVVGSKVGSNENRGMAYEGKLVFTDLGHVSGALKIPNDYNFFNVSYKIGARIHSDSWGCASPNLQTMPTYCNRYGTEASRVDDFMSDYPDFLVLFAAGNDGKYGTGTVGSPATCKNCICVGATDRTGGKNKMATFSSQGPTLEDNVESRRIKPDLVAPGHQIVSAASDATTGSNNCNTKTMSGTSMATPITAGAAALVRQYLTEGWWPTGTKSPANSIPNPPSSLIKALMIASTVPVPTGPTGQTLGFPPDQYQGFGALQLDNILYFPESPFKVHMYWKDFVGTCQERTYYFEVGDKRRFSATLVWTDPEGSPVNGNTLSNDLDLEVKENVPGFMPMYYPNGRRSADRANNVEKIVLDPRADFTRPDGSKFGRYAVIVRGAKVTINDPATNKVTGATAQMYSLVVTGDDVRVSTKPQRPSTTTCLASGAPNPDAYPKPPEDFSGYSKVLELQLAQPVDTADWKEATYEGWQKAVATALGFADVLYDPATKALAVPNPINVIYMSPGDKQVTFDIRTHMIPKYDDAAFEKKVKEVLKGGFALDGKYKLDAAKPILESRKPFFFNSMYNVMYGASGSSGAGGSASTKSGGSGSTAAAASVTASLPATLLAAALATLAAVFFGSRLRV